MSLHDGQPQTPTAKAAADLLASAAPDFLVNHSLRTYDFGMLLVDSPNDVDPEAAFVASVLHDIALTDAFRGADSFELVGAAHAARFLEKQGWELERIRLVEKAIVRHGDLDPADDPVCRVVQAGAALDVVGSPKSAIERPEVAATLARYPRLGFTSQISEAFSKEVAAQPDGLFASFAALGDFVALVEANPLCAHDTTENDTPDAAKRRPQ